ncbi:MAG: beta-propeller fold lactonase family protein [Methanocella sp.]
MSPLPKTYVCLFVLASIALVTLAVFTLAGDARETQSPVNPNVSALTTPTPTPVPQAITLSPAVRNLTVAGNNTTLSLSRSRLILPSQNVAQALPDMISAYSGYYAYVTNPIADDVSVISLMTDTVVDTITLGDGPGSIAFDPQDNTRLYKVNGNTSSLSILYVPVDKQEFNWDPVEKARLSVGKQPFGLAVSPDGLRIYVANMGDGTVTVIRKYPATPPMNIIGFQVIATVSVGKQPHAIAVSPDGKQVYVSCFGTDRVVVIDTATNKVVQSIPVGHGPLGLTVNRYGKVFVANSGDNTVSEIDPASGTVTRSFAVGSYPCAVAMAPDKPAGGLIINPAITGKDPATWVYVANYKSDNVSVINTASGNVGSIGEVHAPLAIAVMPAKNEACVLSPVGNNVYVLNTSDDTLKFAFVSTVDKQQDYSNDDPLGGQQSAAGSYDGKLLMIDYGTGDLRATTTYSGKNHIYGEVMNRKAPQSIILSPDMTKAYVSCYFDNSVLVIDTATNQVTARIAVDPYPRYLAISKDGSRLYVACSDDMYNGGDGSVVKIDATTNQVMSHIKWKPVYPQQSLNPYRMAISDDGNTVYVLCGRNLPGQLYAIDTKTDTVKMIYSSYDQPKGLLLQGSRFLYVTDYSPKQGNASLYELDTAANVGYEIKLDVSDNDYSRPATRVKTKTNSSDLYMTYGSDISVLDTGTVEIIAKYKVDDDSWYRSLGDFDFTPDGRYAYFVGPEVSVYGGGYSELAVIVDTSTGACVGTISYGTSDHFMDDYLGPGIAIGKVPPAPAKPTAPPAAQLQGGAIYSKVGISDLFPGLSFTPSPRPLPKLNRTIILPAPVDEMSDVTPTPAPATPTPSADVGPEVAIITPIPGDGTASQPTDIQPSSRATATAQPAPGFEMAAVCASAAVALWLVARRRN